MEVNSGPESPWSEVVLRHRQFLMKQVEPDFGLVDELYAIEVLSDEEKADINAENTIYKRNAKLLERIQATEQYDAFIDALKSSDQTHVVNYLEKNESFAFDDDWPLLDRQRKILRTNQKTLIELLDVQDILIPLYSAGVINSMQRDSISSKQTSHEKSRTLLDILSRRSIRDYNKLIRCLHDSKQSHIAQILEEGGVVVRVHALIPDDTPEDEIISEFRKRSPEERRRILDELNVIAMKKSESIIVYVYCKTFDELMKFQALKTSRKLVTVLRKLFIDILSFAKCAEVENPRNVVESSFAESQIEKMTVDVSEEEYGKSKKYFLIEEEKLNEIVYPQNQSGLLNLELVNEVERKCEVKDPQGREKVKPEGRYPTELDLNINGLHLELMDIIIRKSFLHSRLEENEMRLLADKDMITRLALVQFNWFQRIIKRRKKKKVPTATLR